MKIKNRKSSKRNKLHVNKRVMLICLNHQVMEVIIISSIEKKLQHLVKMIVVLLIGTSTGNTDRPRRQSSEK